MWTIVIARTEREAVAAAQHLTLERDDLFFVSNSTSRLVVQDADGQRGVIHAVGAMTASRELEGARPDNIVIADDYLSWNLPALWLTRLWGQIQRTVAITPGARVRWS